LQTAVLETEVIPFFDPVLPRLYEDALSEDVFLGGYDDHLDDLILEHLTGRHEGLLRAAIEFVRGYLQTHGDDSDENLLEAGQEEGFSEREIAGALHLLQNSTSNEEYDIAPLWTDYVR
jgi:hypothetical protein